MLCKLEDLGSDCQHLHTKLTAVASISNPSPRRQRQGDSGKLLSGQPITLFQGIWCRDKRTPRVSLHKDNRIIHTYAYMNTCIFPHIHTKVNKWNSLTVWFPEPQRAWWFTPEELRRARQENCCKFEGPADYRGRTRPVRVT